MDHSLSTHVAKGNDTQRARLGFVGTGWIGRHRLQSLRTAGLADIVALCDCSREASEQAALIAPEATCVRRLEDLLEFDLDGVVIATPNHLHVPQTTAALENGLAVFCQKPLARTAAETREIVHTARRADRLLGVDFSYRHLHAAQQLRQLIQQKVVGRVFAADLTFHNAYGPDQPWFYDFDRSGGGCLIDLGIHLADLLLWIFDFPRFEHVHTVRYHEGQLMRDSDNRVEDYAAATWQLDREITARIACSWRLHAGKDAVIGATFYGTEGALSLRNVQGSFYDFRLEHWTGTASRILVDPPDDWGGRSIAQFARQLAHSCAYDELADNLVQVAQLLDRSYGR